MRRKGTRRVVRAVNTLVLSQLDVVKTRLQGGTGTCSPGSCTHCAPRCARARGRPGDRATRVRLCAFYARGLNDRTPRRQVDRTNTRTSSHNNAAPTLVPVYLAATARQEPHHAAPPPLHALTRPSTTPPASARPNHAALPVDGATYAWRPQESRTTAWPTCRRSRRLRGAASVLSLLLRRTQPGATTGVPLSLSPL